MTKQRKKQSFNLPLFAFLLLSGLIGLFVYTVFSYPDFFPFLAIFLTLLAGFLLIQLRYLTQKLARIQIQKQDYLKRSHRLKEEISQELLAIESFKKQAFRYSQIKVLIEKLVGSHSLAGTSKVFSAEVHRLLGHKDWKILLYIFQSRTGEMGISSSQRGHMQIHLNSPKGDIFDQWIVKTMKPLFVEDAQIDRRFGTDPLPSRDLRPIRSLMSVPLAVADRALGILRFDSLQENQFSPEDLKFLTTIGQLGALAIENVQLAERAEDLRVKDSLTGLYLRKHLMERMAQEINRSSQGRLGLSFLMIDLDHFKEYNDRFGHIAGDIVLKEVAVILAQMFRQPGQVVCRYGGEEFCVFLPGSSPEEAMAMAEELRKRVERQTIFLRRQTTRVTVSIGVASFLYSFPHHAQSPEELIHRADQAMYEAKRKGRNRVCGAQSFK